MEAEAAGEVDERVLVDLAVGDEADELTDRFGVLVGEHGGVMVDAAEAHTAPVLRNQGFGQTVERLQFAGGVGARPLQEDPFESADALADACEAPVELLRNAHLRGDGGDSTVTGLGRAHTPTLLSFVSGTRWTSPAVTDVRVPSTARMTSRPTESTVSAVPRMVAEPV